VPCAVVENALLKLFGRNALALGGIDDEDRFRDPARLIQKTSAHLAIQVAVEMPGRQAIELFRRKRQRQGITAQKRCPCNAGPGNREHGGALIQPHHRAAKTRGKESRAASDVQQRPEFQAA